MYQAHSGELGAMVDAVVEGAARQRDVDVRVLGALEAQLDDVLWADGIALGTPEVFGSLGGAMKHLLENVYHSQLDRTRGRVYGLFVRAEDDGAGAVMSAQRIVASLGWRVGARPVVVRGDLGPAELRACHELGAQLATGAAFALA